MSDSFPEPTIAPAVEPDDQRRSDRRRGDRRSIARALWQGALALLVSLIAIAVAALSGWRLLDVERQLAGERAAYQLASRDLDSIRSQFAKLAARSADNAAALDRLASLPPRVDALGTRVTAIESRIDAPQRAVARVEAAQLVEYAQLRLELERDVSGAIRLYEAAAARLAGRDDPPLLRARAQLERELAALRAIPGPDVVALGARLAAAGAAVRALPMQGMIKDQYLPPGMMPTPAPGLARAWQHFTTSLRDLVSVRRVSDASVGLVSMEEIGVRRDHLETLLFAARLAAMRGDATDYAANLDAARDWLGRFFDGHDARVRALDAELAALAASSVSPQLPVLSGSLRLLRGAAP
jgi:uroporphyrin-III C-methyltransferase